MGGWKDSTQMPPRGMGHHPGEPGPHAANDRREGQHRPRRRVGAADHGPPGNKDTPERQQQGYERERSKESHSYHRGDAPPPAARRGGFGSGDRRLVRILGDDRSRQSLACCRRRQPLSRWFKRPNYPHRPRSRQTRDTVIAGELVAVLRGASTAFGALAAPAESTRLIPSSRGNNRPASGDPLAAWRRSRPYLWSLRCLSIGGVMVDLRSLNSWW